MKTLGQLHGVGKNVAGKIIRKAEPILKRVLRADRLARIEWPTQETQIQWARLVEQKYPAISGRFGFVDGKNFSVQEPSNTDLQNAMYNGWLHTTLVTGVLCYGIDGTLIWGKHNIVG